MNTTAETRSLRPHERQPVRAIRQRGGRGRTALGQARIVLLVMINIAQLWVLSATVEAALARRFGVLLPLVIASGICFVISLTILRWWRPTSRRSTSSGYLRPRR